MKILIIKPSSLGDIIHTMPLISDIKNKYPESEITWIVNKNLLSLVQMIDQVDKQIIFDRKLWQNRTSIKEFVKNLIQLYKEIRSQEYDIVIDLQGLLRSGLFTLISKSKIKIGLDNARELSSLFYTQKIKIKNKKLHAIDQNRLSIVFPSEKIPSEKAEFHYKISEQTNNTTSEKLSQKQIGSNFCIISPDARWDSKKWPKENFLKLSNMITKQLDIEVIITGDKNTQKEWKNTILPPKVHLLAGETTIQELINLISKAKFAITNDSGPMHIAVSVGTYVFAILGPTKENKTGPYRSATIIRSNYNCSPCLKKICKKNKRQKTGKCLIELQVEQVYENIITKYETKI